MSESPRGSAPVVSAIVVNHRRADLTVSCLESVERALSVVHAATELILVDNGSGDGSAELIASRVPGAEIVALPENRGFAAAVDAGLRRASGEWVLLLNNDATIEPDGVAHMLAAGRRGDDIGSVAAEMRFAATPGVVNSAGIGVDHLWIAFDRRLGEPAGADGSEPVEVFGASGGAALLRRRMLEELGGLDPSFFFALEDADLAWRARMAGWRALCAPSAVVRHHHGASGRHASAFKHYHVGLNRIRMLAKNAAGVQLRRYWPAIVGYELAYVTYAIVADRTLAPLRGRLRGLREWRAYRSYGEPRRSEIALEPVRGVRAALARRSAWGHGGAPEDGG